MTGFSLSLRLATSALAVAFAAQAGVAQAQDDVAAADAGNAAEIVVTAQKRSERIIDVPVSVNSVGSDQLDRQRVYSLNDLSTAVPSVSSTGAIRGISTTGAARSSAGAVAVLLDGVDLGPPVVGQSQISNLFDVERIEVLSGPQATLFGTTASAGVIQVVTKAPDPTKFEVSGRAEVAEFGFHREQLTVNVPLGANMALRVSGHNDQSKGIVRNTLTGERPEFWDRGVRGRLLWEPSDNLSINLIADYNRGGGNSLRDIAYAIAPTASLQARLAACGITASLNNRENCPAGVNKITARNEKYGFSGQVDLALGDHTLTSITAYRRHRIGDLGYNGPGGDSDFLSENILDTNLTAEDLQTFSQEIRLTSPSNQTLEYVLGLYYFDKNQKDSVIQAGQLGDLGALLRLVNGLPPTAIIGRVTLLDIDQRAYAAFGQATLHVTDKLSLIAGARYTEDKLSDVSRSLTPTTTPTLGSYGYSFVVNPFAPGVPPAFFLAPVNQSVKVNNFSWKLGAQYEFSRSLMTYFTATRGYKGPSVNDQAAPPIAIPIIRPEIPMNYELGMKGAFFDNRVLVTLALFHNKVKDFQTSIYVPPSAGNPAGSFATGNAPFIKSRGVDLNIFARPTDELTLNAGLLYNKGTYADTFLVACAQGATPGVGDCSAAGLTTPVSQLAGVPKWRLLLNGEYATEVKSGLTVFFQADATYESSRFSGTTPDPLLDINGETIVNARVGFRATDRRWAASIFAKNLLGTDQSRLQGDPLTGFNGGGGQSYWIAPARGLTAGATVDFKF
ncbi:TonB-dependent receptor [Sphingopyxis sp.]|jgi:iron complex outermembrane receptor protein|uniref:TonB-dependent receptor n=1 Tax=Sphingopyxis sp. TaxID=1908224 RepID=UPI002DF31B1A|nr:TonB-dependent receptor [Sphingopyxis sp.]